MSKNIVICCFMIFSISGFSQNIYFPPLNSGDWDTISPSSLNYCENKIEELYDFLEFKNTKSFILLKDGKIVLEKYFGTHNVNSFWYWASAGKTLTSFMVGLAQQESYLNIHDKTSKFLGPGWTSSTPAQEDKITIWHQLTMTSGLDDSVSDPYCTIDTCLVYLADAGTRWSYHNAPFTLLDLVIQNATGLTMNNFVFQKLKNNSGISGFFFPSSYNNVFSSTARSMARFGLLILNKGKWDKTTIMTDTAYFDQMTHRSQSINEAYGYLWWLNGSSTFMVPQSQFKFPGSISPDAPADMIAALGKNGQFLNVVPSKNIVWLRMGDAPDDSEVSFLLNNDIWKYINDLDCTVSKNKDNTDNKPKISVFPNPAKNQIRVISDKKIKKIKILTINGDTEKTFYDDFWEMEISYLKEGVYIMQISTMDNQVYYNKFIKL